MKIFTYTKRTKILLFVLEFLIIIFAFRHINNSFWRPDFIVKTVHFVIESTATKEQTEKMGSLLEKLYVTYKKEFGDISGYNMNHEPLKMKFYKDRKEFRKLNRAGWAEAYYLKPYCHAYYSNSENNPYHWMIHEGTHQLNAELSNMDIPKWLNEGIAIFFGTSRIEDEEMKLGDIDLHTYPVWWIISGTVSGDLEADLAQEKIIPLSVIVSEEGGPDINRYFNLYYIHWFTLMHFLMEGEGGKYKEKVKLLIQHGADVEHFEKYIGPIEDIQKEWYEYFSTELMKEIIRKRRLEYQK